MIRVAGMSLGRLASLCKSLSGSAWGGSGPYKAVVCATYRCGCHCSFCGIWRRKVEELPAHELVTALASWPNLAWVDVTGGELFLRPDYLALCLGLARALPRLALFHFPTAGQHGDQAVDLARRLTALGIRTVVTVSLDGPPERHEGLRGVAGAWERAVATFLRLRKEPGVDVYFGTTLVPENVEEVPGALFAAVQSVVPDISPAHFHVNVMQQSGHYFHNETQPRPAPEQVRAALWRFVRFKGLPRAPFDGMELAYQMVAMRSSRGGSAPLCRAIEASVFVGPDGTVHPCHVWSRPLGKVGSNRPLSAVLSGPVAKAARGEVARGECPQCWTPCEAYPTLISTLMCPFTGRSS